MHCRVSRMASYSQLLRPTSLAATPDADPAQYLQYAPSMKPPKRALLPASSVSSASHRCSGTGRGMSVANTSRLGGCWPDEGAATRKAKDCTATSCRTQQEGRAELSS